MGIPSKVAENSFIAAEKLIRVQFPAGLEHTAATSATPSSNNSPTDPTAGSPPAAGGSDGDLPGGDADSSSAAAEAEGAPREDASGGGGGRGQQPMGVVCSCVRTGWSLMSSLFCVGEEVRLYPDSPVCRDLFT